MLELKRDPYVAEVRTVTTIMALRRRLGAFDSVFDGLAYRAPNRIPSFNFESRCRCAIPDLEPRFPKRVMAVTTKRDGQC